jgi:hypothetical protein
MTGPLRPIEVDAATAAVLEREAKARGVTLAEFLAGLARESSATLPPDLETMRAKGRGPWAPSVIAEDVREMAEFEANGEGVPFEDVTAWVESWGTANELPIPKPRKLRRSSFRGGPL